MVKSERRDAVGGPFHCSSTHMVGSDLRQQQQQRLTADRKHFKCFYLHFEKEKENQIESSVMQPFKFHEAHLQ